MSGCESAPTPSPETPPTATSGSGTETPPEASTGEEALAVDPVEPEPIPLEELPEPAGTQQPSPIDESQIPPMPSVNVGDGSGTPNDAPRDAETMRGLSSNQLIGRHYFADAPGAEFRELHFLESIVVIGMRDGSEVAFPADMSGHHPLCADVPSCVVLLAPDGTPTPFYFSGLEFTMSPFSMITRAECRVAITHRDAPWQTLIDVIERNEGSNVAHSTDAAICWLVGLVPYREVPSWWTQRDEDEYQRQRALMRAQRETHAEATGEEIPEHDLLPPPDPQLPYPDPANIDEGRFGPIGEGGVLLPDGSAGGSPFGMPGGGMPPGAMPPTGNPGDMMAPGGMPPGYGAPGGP